MADYPITFKPDFIEFIGNGLKTQTRRMKGLEFINKAPDFYRAEEKTTLPGYDYRFTSSGRPAVPIKCPYGAPGGRLWVREGLVKKPGDLAAYTADGELVTVDGYPADWPYQVNKCSPIFMPKHFARLWLGIISIRPERLHDMTEPDAFAEGIPKMRGLDAVDAFSRLWDGIYLAKGWAWDFNPWVWRIEFKLNEVK